jgi:putative DNA primase/helicase
MPDTRKAALKYADFHWDVFPLAPETKEPLTPNGFKNATIDSEIINGWWEKWPSANIGLACGMSGVIALDGDPLHYTDETRAFLADLEENHPTARQVTPTGGHHYVYMLPQGVTLNNSSGSLPPGIDVRVNGFIVLSPSTVTYSGDKAKEKGVEDGFRGRYRWDPSPKDFPPQPLPEHVLELLLPKQRQTPPPYTNGYRNGNGNGANGHHARDDEKERYAKAALEKELDILARTSEGGRNEQLNKSAFNLGQLVAVGLLSESEVCDQLEIVARSIRLDDREIKATIKSGLGDGKGYPRVVPETPRLKFTNGAGSPAPFAEAAHFTDMGNAQRMHALVKGQVFYVPQFDKWYIWAGTHWQEDNTFEIVKAAKQTVVNMYAEAATLDDDKRKELIKWAIKSEARQRLEAMIALLRSEPGIAVQPEELDRDPLLLACKNGTLDLPIGELLPPNPDHLITKCIGVDYDSEADCPTWEKFLIRIMDDDLELVAFIQRLIGHALTGDATGKYMVFMYGPKGNNGKSTLVETIMRLLGPYAMKSPSEMVMAKMHRGGIPNDIARLRGVRFTVTNEVDEGMTLSESVIKDLTGNDTLTARFMRAEFFDFTPTHKLWIYGNHKPEIKGTDTAIWDRVKLIPFDVEIPKSERDPLMLDKLTVELPGILAWAVRGNMLWQRRGIAAPESVTRATGEYRTEQDTVGQFVTDCCEAGTTFEASAGALYRAYETWAKQLGLRPEDGTKFGSDLGRRGFQKKRTKLGNMRSGIQLNEFGRSLGPAPSPHWSDER